MTNNLLKLIMFYEDILHKTSATSYRERLDKIINKLLEQFYKERNND